MGNVEEEKEVWRKEDWVLDRLTLRCLWDIILEMLIDLGYGFRKGKWTGDQITNIRWIMEKAIEFQKNIYFCFIDYAKAFDCVDHNKLWKIQKAPKEEDPHPKPVPGGSEGSSAGQGPSPPPLIPHSPANPGLCGRTQGH